MADIHTSNAHHSKCVPQLLSLIELKNVLPEVSGVTRDIYNRFF